MHALPAVGDTEVFTLWWISVGVVFVVCIVATGLLQNILVVVRNIDENIGEIWTVGKRIANNTVELWMLGRVNSIVADIRASAYRINDVAGTIARHAAECQHCPACANPRIHAMRASSEPWAGGRADLTGQPQQGQPAERSPWSRPQPAEG